LWPDFEIINFLRILAMVNDLVLFEHPLFITDMMYARENNMVGKATYADKDVHFGNVAYMHKDVAEALLSLVPVLQEKQLKMRICDAYRPPLAHQKMVEIVPIKGFFKADYRTSNHCHGTAVDVCLTDMNGHNLLYPTEIDAYEERFQKQVSKGEFAEFQQHLQKARHDFMDAAPEALANRAFLKQLMETHGFESIPHEWWHYNLKGWAEYPVIEWE
jgi:D-alanyl-D-alanine dipeptidase